jgi:hypothetical protein
MNTRRSFLGCLAALPLLALWPLRWFGKRPRRICSIRNGRWLDPTTWAPIVPREGDFVFVSHKIDCRGVWDLPSRLTITMDNAESELRFT